jgi:hypothetical protein
MADTLKTKFRKETEARLEELRPHVEEARELEDLLQTLDAGTTTKPSGGGRRRRTGTGRGEQRASQFLSLVERTPEGITVTEAAKAMDIEPNYLYRVAGELAEKGEVRKDGSTYLPKEGADAEEKETAGATS